MFSPTRFRERTALLRKYLFRYRKWVTIGLLALICVDILEIIPPYLLKLAVDSLVAGEEYRKIVEFAGIYLLVYFLQGVCRWGWRVFLVRSSFLAGRDLREDFGRHLFSMPAGFYDKNRVGDLMSLVNSDVDSVRQFLGPGILIFADALFYLATVPVAMFLLSPELTLLALIPIPIIPFIVWKLENAIHDRYKSAQDQFSKLSSHAQENLNGIRVVKAFSRERTQYQRFLELGKDYVQKNLRLALVHSSFGPVMDFFTSLGLVLLLWWGGREVMDDSVTLGTFVAFQRYIQKMVWPMTALGLAASHYQRALASSERMNEVFKQKTNIRTVTPTDGKTKEKRSQVQGRIEIRNLNFSFPTTYARDPQSSNPLVLRNLSLTIEPGMRAAFVGRIGSGKSTLFSLLPRLYPAPEKSIFFDGIPIEDWPLEELRSQMGYVSQDVFLFSESVRENILFAGRFERTPEEMASRVLIAEEVQSFEKGYDTLLGERGVNLSGGQKQRLSLARALAAQPKVLILDDAFSAVDVRTEEKILAELRGKRNEMTELISAHRLSTIQEADRIFVLERGELVQEGKHTELIRERSGIYWKFYEEQRLKEDLESYMQKWDRRIEDRE